jgi:transcriptional regulator with XRE-family HTH domain
MTNQQEILLRNKVIGAMLRQARNKSGKSLKEMAALIGTNPGRLSAYERGLKAISIPELELFSYQLNIPIRGFLGEEPGSKPAKADIDPRILISLRRRMIGALLKTHRIEANLSIRKLSRETQLPASRISAYERGSRSIPLPDLEILAERLGRRVDDYIDSEGPIGTQEMQLKTVDMLSKLQPDLREFLSNPVNEPYLRLAKRLSELDVDRLRTVAEGLLEITL